MLDPAVCVVELPELEIAIISCAVLSGVERILVDSGVSDVGVVKSVADILDDS